MPLESAGVWFDEQQVRPVLPVPRPVRTYTDHGHILATTLSEADIPGRMAFVGESRWPSVPRKHRAAPVFNPGLIRPEIEDVDRLIAWAGQVTHARRVPGAVSARRGDYSFDPDPIPVEVQTSVTYLGVPAWPARQGERVRRGEGDASPTWTNVLGMPPILPWDGSTARGGAIKGRGVAQVHPGSPSPEFQAGPIEAMAWVGASVKPTALLPRVSHHEESSPSAALIGEVPIWTVQATATWPTRHPPVTRQGEIPDPTPTFFVDVPLWVVRADAAGPRRQVATVLPPANPTVPFAGTAFEVPPLIYSQDVRPTRYPGRGATSDSWPVPMSVIIVGGPYYVVAQDVWTGGADAAQVEVS